MLMSEHLDAAIGLAWAVLADRAAAEDAVQEAMVRAWRALPQLRDRARLHPWLLQIVANEARRVGRQRARERWLPWTLVSSPPQRWPDDLEGRADVRAVIASLSRRDREILVVRYFLDMPVEEAAHFLGVSIPAVKARSVRAAVRLREALRKREERQ